MKERVAVAMSGGVDSSTAAAILKRQGYEVIGMTMCFNLPDFIKKVKSCCGIQGIEDARRVAYRLNIRHYTINMGKALADYVIKDFCLEYLNGRTPNPCIRCNQYIKFDALLKKAIALDSKFLATGHYARITRTKKGYVLKKAKDLNKDQSYFLYRLNQRQLKNILFPLGGYTKPEVRNLAREFGLPVADKVASQEICFLPESDYRSFLRIDLKKDIKPGPVVDQQGNVLGSHQGIPFYTIGQREGLGIARGYPLYVTKIDPEKNLITVGTRKDVLRSEFWVRHPHFISKPIKKRVALKVKIRYNHREALAELLPLKEKLRVRFKTPQFAITPGQSAVFYDRDKVLGGGIIDICGLPE